MQRTLKGKMTVPLISISKSMVTQNRSFTPAAFNTRLHGPAHLPSFQVSLNKQNMRIGAVSLPAGTSSRLTGLASGHCCPVLLPGQKILRSCIATNSKDGKGPIAPKDREETEEEWDDEEEAESLEGEEDIVIDDEIATNMEEDMDWEFEFEDQDEEEDLAALKAGDGGDGGGIVLSDAPWGETALRLAQETLSQPEFASDFAIYAFKVEPKRQLVRLRLDKLSDVYGSPSLPDMDSFLLAFDGRMKEAGTKGEAPEEVQIEVSSPGAERLVRVPQDLARFQELPLFVVYYYTPTDGDKSGERVQEEEILQLVNFSEEERVAEWKVADVRVNREFYGGVKGKPLSKRVRERRLKLTFEDIKLVRVFLEL